MRYWAHGVEPCKRFTGNHLQVGQPTVSFLDEAAEHRTSQRLEQVSCEHNGGAEEEHHSVVRKDMTP